MNPDLLFNVLSACALVACGILTIRCARGKTGYGTSLAVIGTVVAIKSFVVLSNILEHASGNPALDRIEEYFEITLPVLYFLFFVTLSLQDSHRTIERQKGSLKRLNEGLEAEVARKAAELERTYSELADTRIALVNRNRAASFDQVIRKISHLLNTPLGICITSATSLECGDSDSSGETFRLLRRSLDRIIGLTTEIRRVLDLRTEEEKSRFLLSSLLDEVASEIMGETNVAFDYSVMGGDAGLFGYRENLKKVLRELMRNSVIHNPGNPKLSVEVEFSERGDRDVLTFRDDGKGIPEGFLDKIFDPFVTPRLSDSSLGLGLFMVRSIVQNVFYGDVAALPAEQGACFAVTVPAMVLSGESAPRSGGMRVEI